PVDSYKNMRGIAYDLPENAGEEEIRKRCEARLLERGVEAPMVALTEVDGRRAIMLPTMDARILLAPVSAGHRATKLSTKPVTYDPDAKGYSGDNGAFLVQAADLAYENEETVQAYTKAWGFDDATFVSNAESDAQAFIAKDVARNTIVIAF